MSYFSEIYFVFVLLSSLKPFLASESCHSNLTLSSSGSLPTSLCTSTVMWFKAPKRSCIYHFKSQLHHGLKVFRCDFFVHKADFRGKTITGGAAAVLIRTPTWTLKCLHSNTCQTLIPHGSVKKSETAFINNPEPQRWCTDRLLLYQGCESNIRSFLKMILW